MVRISSLFMLHKLVPLITVGNLWLCAVSGILGKNVRQFIEQNTVEKICKQPLSEALRRRLLPAECSSFPLYVNIMLHFDLNICEIRLHL